MPWLRRLLHQPLIGAAPRDVLSHGSAPLQRDVARGRRQRLGAWSRRGRPRTHGVRRVGRSGRRWLRGHHRSARRRRTMPGVDGQEGAGGSRASRPSRSGSDPRGRSSGVPRVCGRNRKAPRSMRPTAPLAEASAPLTPWPRFTGKLILPHRVGSGNSRCRDRALGIGAVALQP